MKLVIYIIGVTIWKRVLCTLLYACKVVKLTAHHKTKSQCSHLFWGGEWLADPFLFSEDILAEISAEKVTTIVNRSDIGHILWEHIQASGGVWELISWHFHQPSFTIL